MGWNHQLVKDPYFINLYFMDNNTGFEKMLDLIHHCQNAAMNFGLRYLWTPKCEWMKLATCQLITMILKKSQDLLFEWWLKFQSLFFTSNLGDDTIQPDMFVRKIPPTLPRG